MQQLLQLKPRDEPQDSFVSTDDLFDLKSLNENSGQINELKDLFSFLFKPSFLLELKEETKSLNITLDEEEKKLILKLKKKTRSKSLAKRGQVYALRKEMRMTSLTLVYNYRPSYVTLNELQPIVPMQPMTDLVKPLEITQPITMLKTPKLPIKPILINNPDDITIVLPLPEYTENLLRELPTRPYEEKFRPITGVDTYSEETLSDSEDYRIGPEKLKRLEDLVQQYQSELNTFTQNFEKRLNEPQIIKYAEPRLENGELIYQKIKMTPTKPTTVYDSIRNSGLPIGTKYSPEFKGIYVKSFNGIKDNGTNGIEGSEVFWEYTVNGQYGTTTVDKAKIKPGDEVAMVLKTAKPGVCGSNNRMLPNYEKTDKKLELQKRFYGLTRVFSPKNYS